MTEREETEMHELAARLEQLTRGSGWEAMRYGAIAQTMEALAKYCAVCDCQRPCDAPQTASESVENVLSELRVFSFTPAVQDWLEKTAEYMSPSRERTLADLLTPQELREYQAKYPDKLIEYATNVTGQLQEAREYIADLEKNGNL